MDLDVLKFLAAPFVASLILTGIHAYLGVHVVERGRHLRRPLARPDRRPRHHDRDPAALHRAATRTGPGSTGSASSSPSSAPRSSRRSAVRRARIPQEAIIGIAYAVASAAAILAMSKATSESEHLKDMLVGNILAVSWPEVGKTAALYAAIGALPLRLPPAVPRHLDGPREGRARRARRCGFWDFLFYASFGFVVTSSVLDRRRAARVLLPDRAVGGGDALRRAHRPAAGDRLDDGHGRLGARHLPLGQARPADRAPPWSARSASC